MVKKNTAHVTAAHLVDASKRGTLIIGSMRCGSHFVQSLCAAQCQIQGIVCNKLGELHWSYLHQEHAISNLIKDLELDDRYHLIIINHLVPKLDLLSRDNMDDWLVVRVVTDDKHRWYQSVFWHKNSQWSDWRKQMLHKLVPARRNGKETFFMGNSDAGDYYDKLTWQYLISWTRENGEYYKPELKDITLKHIVDDQQDNLHHGQPRELYEKFLDSVDLEQDQSTLQDLSWSMTNHWLSRQVPVDYELNYRDLPGLASEQVPWRPNNYPDIDVLAQIAEGRLIEQLLTLWIDPPGKFKDRT